MERRTFEYEILEEIKLRWSPHAFSTESLAEEDVLAVLEAARYAPSCYNEQPWRFIVAKDSAALSKMRPLMTEKNRAWADNAPVLILILAKKTFTQDGSINNWHLFDAGTAWGFLSLEAQRRGLITHAMAGFSRKRAAESYGLPEDLAPVAMIALGKYGDAAALPDALRAEEYPELRRSVTDSILSITGENHEKTVY